MSRFKVEILVPQSHVESVLSALHRAGAGRIGAYDHCSTSWKVSGTWRPLAGSNPYSGEVGVVERGEEWRVESICDEEAAPAVLSAVRSVHPYEEPVVVFLPIRDVVVGA